MPTISTGNPGWDQNLSTLGNALFPDPSKIAQGYYYGSEARAKQLESNKLIDQQNWRNRYGMQTQGGAQPAPPTWQQMDNVPGAAPVVMPPSNLPYSAAAAAAPVPAGAHNLAAAAANTTPPQAATALSTIIPPFTTGRAQEFGAPAPGLPVAPQTTTSNGQAPANDQSSGQLHFASTTPEDGGPKQSGPAAHNGSPAPMPPGMTLPGLMAMSAAGSLGGLDAASVQAGGSALAYELYSRGVIGRDQYHQMLGATGSPTLATADTAAAASITTTGMTNRTELEKQRMVTGENARQFNIKPVPVIDPGTDQPVFTPQSETTGKRVYEPTVAAVVAGAASKTGNFYDPKDPGKTIFTTAGDARARGLVERAGSTDRVTADLNEKILTTKDPEEQRRLVNNAIALNASPKTPPTREQVFQTEADAYRVDQESYPRPQSSVVPLGVENPVGFKPAAEGAIYQRMRDLGDNDRRLYNDPTTLRRMAIQDLKVHPTKEGLVLPSEDEVNQARVPPRNRLAGLGDPRLSPRTPPGQKSADHMMVDLQPMKAMPASATPPGTPAPAIPSVAPGTVTTTPGSAPAPAPASTYQTPDQRLGNIFNWGITNPGGPPAATAPAGPPAPYQTPDQRLGNMFRGVFGGGQPTAAATPPPEAPAAAAAPVGRAPPGTPEGATIYFPGTNTVAGVNRGGLVYPQ